jgi:hypothetical protein
MKSVFFLVALVCNGGEGCSEDRLYKEPAFSTRAECLVRAEELQVNKRRVKYKCSMESEREYARILQRIPHPVAKVDK